MLTRYGDAAFARDRDLARDLLDRPDRIPFMGRRGGLFYNFWRDDAHPRGLWRRTDEATYRAGDPVWWFRLDPDALAARENEDWVWSGSVPFRDGCDRAMLRLSRGGGPAVVLREFDIPTRAFVADGFILRCPSFVDVDATDLSSLATSVLTKISSPSTISCRRSCG